MSEWGFSGRRGRILIYLVAEPNGDAPGWLTGQVTAQLEGPGRFTGACAVAFSASELVRFHRDLGLLLAGQAQQATLGRLGDGVGLTLDAVEGRGRLSGYLGAGMGGAVSFNDLELEPLSLRRTHRELERILCELEGDPPPMRPRRA
jgi:hypothetical protein